MSTPLRTARLTLRPFTPADLPDVTTLMTNPVSMVDYGRPDTPEQAAAKFARYLDAQARHGISRMHVSDRAGFAGYVGVFPQGGDHVLGQHAEIGWRLLPRAQGHGYATEAARATLSHAFTILELDEILSYTAPDNLRSQAVMSRLGLDREPHRDFTLIDPDIGPWSGMVWVARRADWSEAPDLPG